VADGGDDWDDGGTTGCRAVPAGKIKYYKKRTARLYCLTARATAYL